MEAVKRGRSRNEPCAMRTHSASHHPGDCACAYFFNKCRKFYKWYPHLNSILHMVCFYTISFPHRVRLNVAVIPIPGLSPQTPHFSNCFIRCLDSALVRSCDKRPSDGVPGSKSFALRNTLRTANSPSCGRMCPIPCTAVQFSWLNAATIRRFPAVALLLLLRVL